MSEGMHLIPPTEPSIIESIISALQHYIPIPGMAFIGGMIWRVSAKNTSIEQTQVYHDERLKEHHSEIAALKAAQAANAAVVAGLPNRQDIRDVRDEMRAQGAQLQSQMQSGFDSLSQIIRRND